MTERPNHQRRFGALARLYGSQGASQIFNSHIVVIGIGGVGSWCAEALARSGVGRLTLIDLDHIAESNINRQIHSMESTLGQAKIEAMRLRILDINPDCQIHLIDDFVTPENWAKQALQINEFASIDGLIDACDQVAAKTALAAWALQHPRLAFVAVGAAGGKQQAELVEISDLSAVTHDPLLAKLRYNLKRYHGATRAGELGIRCVHSKESVQAPQHNHAASDLCESNNASDGSLNCHGFGSSVAVTATFGMCAAGEIMKLLVASK